MKDAATNIARLYRAQVTAFLAFKAEKDFHKAEKLSRNFTRAYNRWQRAAEIPPRKK